jgi:hypothetical protein
LASAAATATDDIDERRHVQEPRISPRLFLEVEAQSQMAQADCLSAC